MTQIKLRKIDVSIFLSTFINKLLLILIHSTLSFRDILVHFILTPERGGTTPIWSGLFILIIKVRTLSRVAFSFHIGTTRHLGRLRFITSTRSLRSRNFFLLNFLLLQIFHQSKSKIHKIIPGFSLTSTIHPLHLITFKRNDGAITNNTNLVMHVDTIDQRHLAEIFIFDLKEIHIIHLIIAVIERLGETRIPTFHEFLHTNVLQHVQNVLWDCLRDCTVVHRGIECMTDFMTHQQVVDGARDVLPDRQAKSTTIDFKIRSRNLTVLYIQVLCCQKFGKGSFNFGVDRHRTSFRMYLI